MIKVVLTLLAILAAGCGPRMLKESTSVEKLSGALWCAKGMVAHAEGVSRVYVCTPSHALCQTGVKKSEGVGGKLAGVKSVSECKLLFY